MKVKGIHHISAIVKHAQENVDFYYGLLGLRMVGKTVNFDDPTVYHLYYANNESDLGSIITFFPWDNRSEEGIVGGGQVGSTIYQVPKMSLSFWEDRLNKFKIDNYKVKRFGQTRLVFTDPHGITNEIVESKLDIFDSSQNSQINKENAILGFLGAKLLSRDPEKTKKFLLSTLKLNLINENDHFYQFDMDAKLGNIIELSKNPVERGRLSSGTVHHIAFTVGDSEIDNWKTKLEEAGFHPTEVKERRFFRSIYFKEPGGTIIELATEGPGMLKASNVKMDKDGFTLPDFHEHLRDEVKSMLYPVFTREINELKKYPYSDLTTYNSYVAHQERLARINELARISKTRKLTETEIKERAKLREEYIKTVVGTVRQSLDTVEIENEDGSINTIKKGGKKKWKN